CITYVDCGCVSDHVPPPAADGPRVPMVIVSPYARAGFTDSTGATFASMLAYTEHAFDLPSLGGNDYGAYDFTNSFDYTQTPLPPVPLSQHPVPAASKRYVATHVVPPDGT